MTGAVRRSASPPVEVDVVVDCALWSACADAERIVERAIGAAAVAAGEAGSVAVMLTDDASIRLMNARWRGIDRPTNVLSFPAGESGSRPGLRHLGDIALAYETVAAESSRENKVFGDHLAHLAVHGYLHLAGFDHETEAEAVRMEHLETRVLSGLGIADPYSEPNAAD